MKDRVDRASKSNLVVSALLVVIFAFTTALLLLSAFIIWFAEAINSITLSLVITSAITGVMAFSIYKVTLSPSLKQLREEYEMLIAIVNLVRGGCQSVLNKILNLLGL